MSKWKQTINIKQHLSGDVSAEGIKKAATAITSEVAAVTSTAPMIRFVAAYDMADADPETALLVFNDAMDRLYDWADDNRVWLA